MPGPPPKPTNLKLLHGTFRADRANSSEPQPTPELAMAPEHLSPVAREEWDRLAPELYQLGLLTTADQGVFAAYCQSWADWIEAEGHVAGKCGCVAAAVDEADAIRIRTVCGQKIVYTDRGNPVQNPWVALRNKAREQMLKFAAQFGLTPSSRSRVTATPPTDGNGDDGLLD